jgi:hypothetical protein
MSIYQQLAAARFPNSAKRARIFGDGPYVLGIACGKPKILLYPTAEARLKKLQQIDRGCGYACRDEHDLFQLEEVK